ncbi:MAG: hypothetical protein JWO13_1874 [Acidobacteriales bacterium]|nr:hypothetical protein [Terriglobales bacterium]
MKKSFVLPLAILILSSLAFAGDGKHYTNFTSNNSDSANCQDHLKMYSDDKPAQARSEETITIANQPLRVTASRNGGISVKNWDKQEFSIKICRLVAARTESEAQQALGKIRLNSQAGTVSVDGPDRNNDGYVRNDDDPSWSAVLIILAPVGSTMDLTSQNGGISLNRVSANVTAHSQNGGIALKETSGKMDVEARNGGISIKDCGGDVKATVQNGGLSIELAENWNGTGLDAKTHNGGLVVSIPKNFQSSLEIASNGHSGMICQSEACEGGQRTWDDNGRIFKIGNSTPVIHASTVNGGIVIKSREHRGEI